MLIVVASYATAPFLANRRLADVPSLGVIQVALVGATSCPAAAVICRSAPRCDRCPKRCGTNGPLDPSVLSCR